jgi:hypothetical protein
MNNVFTTIFLTIIVVLLAMAVIAIGWLLTGKSRVRLGMCGRDPTAKRNDKEGCGKDISCSICEKTDKETKK